MIDNSSEQVNTQQLFVARNIRNLKPFSFPFFNMYLTSQHLMVVPVMSRSLSNISAISFILFVAGLSEFERIESAITVFAVFLITFVWSYKDSARRLNDLDAMSLDQIMSQPGFATTYDNVAIIYTLTRAKLSIAGRTVHIRKRDARKLETMIRRFKNDRQNTTH